MKNRAIIGKNILLLKLLCIYVGMTSKHITNYKVNNDCG